MNLQYDFDNSIGYWIIRSAQAIERALNQELSPHGISHRQWQVLAWLALEGELCQADLAERMRIEPPTLVRVLDRMEQAGWIIRRDDPQDRRKKVVAPTKQAEPVWSRAADCARRVRAAATDGMIPDEQERLRNLLRKIVQNVDVRSQTDDHTPHKSSGRGQ